MKDKPSQPVSWNSGFLKRFASKVFLYSAALAGTGLAVLWEVERVRLNPIGRTAWLLPAIQSVASTVAGVGLVGLLFEFAARRAFTREITLSLRSLFDEDPSFALSLSEDKRRQRVRNTLKAHLGETLGEAVFSGVVARYFDPSSIYRDREASFRVAFSSLDEADGADFFGKGVKLRTEMYCGFQADYAFCERFPADGALVIACTLSEEVQDMLETFRRRGVVAREVIRLEKGDHATLLETLDALLGEGESAQERLAATMERVVKVDLWLNGERLSGTPSLAIRVGAKTPGVPRNAKDVCGINFEFKPPASWVPMPQDSWHIRICSVYARAAGRFPLFIAHPTKNPEFRFAYRGTGLTDVAATTFLTGHMSFEPQIVHSEESIRVATADKEHPETWIFPGSGVLFTWQAGLDQAGAIGAGAVGTSGTSAAP